MNNLLPTVFSPQGDWRQTLYNPETGESFFCECFRDAIINASYFHVFHPHVKYALEKNSYLHGICHVCRRITPPPKCGITNNTFSFKRTYGAYIFKIMYQDKKEKSFKEAENILRNMLGYPLKGKGLISELLFNYIKDLFPNTNVIQHGKPDFLGNQHFDIWLPELKIAVEFQGEQHKRPVDYFGGEEAFALQKENDKKKRKLSKANGVILFSIDSDYTKLIEFIANRI